MAGFVDGVSWEAVKLRGEPAIKAWIARQLSNTSVTVVMIGADTASRPFVRYEIQRSHERGNGLLGVYVHNMRDQAGRTSPAGPNPFDLFTVGAAPSGVRLSQVVPTYDWYYDNGYLNFGQWVEAAARAAKR